MRAKVLVLMVTFLLVGCAAPDGPSTTTGPPTVGTSPSPTTTTSTAPPEDLPRYGLAVSPQDGPTVMAPFFAEAPGIADAVVWSGLIDSLASPRSLPSAAANRAAEEGLAFGLMTSPFRQEQDGFAVPFDVAGQQRWRDTLVNFLNDHEVTYLGLGIEVNYWKEVTSDRDYATFQAWYAGVASLLDDTHPDVAVFPVFQYELMRGMQGGLWGGTNGQEPTWERLEDFPDRDMLGFTLYPGLSVPDPERLGDAYWDDLARGEPLAIVESGWHSHQGEVEGFASDPEEQARFMDALLQNVTDHNLLVWTFLYDQEGSSPFHRMGLKDADGVTRPAYDRWVAQPGQAPTEGSR